ncbi:MAG TPA: Smr/MutS family protein [Bryobacteraceae bacterium]|nr:Smr/MutS family protein [Bryobacteraceae bacterium]
MRFSPALEFEELRALLGRYVRSPLGRAELERAEPRSDRAVVEAMLADTAETIEFLQASSQPQPAGRGAAIRPRFDLAADPAPLIARLRIEGAILEGGEIFELTRVLDLAFEARSLLLPAEARFPRLAAQASGIADLRGLAAELRGKILPNGWLADAASPALGRIRRDLERQRRLIQESLERFLRVHRQDGTLQEEFVAIRNERFVVPVVAGRERRVDGVIHGSSSSGRTVFVEPLETIQLNNDLVQLHEDELRETQRLLREFTARLREHAEPIAASAAALGRVEFLFAKAEFAEDFGCSIPRLSPEGERRMVLREARHPLLESILRAQGKKAVPISLTLEDPRRTLLISGPNTGGKTVALKAAGLLALMAHAGFPTPAAEAEIPLFDRVLADIGDHQSLQESLSSFSAHILAVRSMLAEATGNSLILLDELGSSTDPEEGGALGVVILEAFAHLGAFTIATTHLTALKVYGATAAGVSNAAMGFEEGTLEPTYVLRLGAPGKSAGLDIAARLGFDPAMIAAARERLTHGERDVAGFLAELDRQVRALEEERANLASRERALKAREASLEQSWERKYAAKLREIERRAEELAAQFQKRAEGVMEELRQKGALRKAQASVAKTQREYREAVQSLTPAAAETAPAIRLAEGAQVRLKGIRQTATVRRLLSGEILEVEAGFLKMRVPSSEVEEVLRASDAPARPSGIEFHQGPASESFHREINLVGQRAEEACGAVEKFLDTAVLAQAERVRIVHGHGMGILKRAVAEVLRDNPHVAKFYGAPPEEGGSGATIVELK